MGLPNPTIKYTYKDYLTWIDDKQWELIDGTPFDMSPSLSFRHQYVLLQLASEFREFFKEKSCIPCLAPLDVRFPLQDEADE